ncbi:MAG: OmpA family protein [Cyclobacteriaceae bacterium]|nr:OmpA family protein [Cyclobacteriaceae bacterium]
MKKTILIILLGINFAMRAQSPVSHMPSFSPLNSDITYAAGQGHFITLNYNKSYISPNNAFNHFLMNAAFALNNKENENQWGGLGFSLEDIRDVQTLGIKTTRPMIFFAVRKKATPTTSLSFGAKSGFEYLRVDSESITTESMWVKNKGFDPGAPSGEDMKGMYETTPLFGAGFSLRKNDRYGAKMFEGGASLSLEGTRKHKQASLFDQPGASYILFSRITALQLETFDIVLNASSLIANPVFHMQAGICTRLKIKENNPFQNVKKGSVDLALHTTNGKILTPSFELKQKNYDIGFAYYFGVKPDIRNHPANAFEVGLTIRSLLRKKIPDTTTSKGQRKEIRFRADLPPGQKPLDTLLAVKPAQNNNPPTGNSVTTSRLEFGHTFHFAFNHAGISSHDQPYLDSLVNLLKNEQQYYLIIIGHADSIGTEKANNKISYLRARAVADYLRQQGIAVQRLTPIGKGETDPLTENTTEEKRAINRRVEFILYRRDD